MKFWSEQNVWLSNKNWDKFNLSYETLNFPPLHKQHVNNIYTLTPTSVTIVTFTVSVPVNTDLQSSKSVIAVVSIQFCLISIKFNDSNDFAEDIILTKC